MKKHECNYCKTNQVQTCPVCGSGYEDSHKITSHSNLYAAEFLLYAFHFEDYDGKSESRLTRAHPLMMMVAEG